MSNRHVEQHLQSQKLSRRSKNFQWEPTTNDEMLKILEGEGLQVTILCQTNAGSWHAKVFDGVS